MSYFFSHKDWRKQTVERRAPVFSKKEHSKKSRIKRFFKTILTLFIGGLLFCSIFFIIFIVWALKDLPDPNKIRDREIPLTTKIYERTGKTVLYEIHGAEKRTAVELKAVPKYLIEATLTAEDRNFYTHRGFSLTGIVRSIIKNIRTGERVGGSTITQQLIKNAILTSEKTYTRKAKELILSYQIERKFSKDDILKMYFNEIPYGSVIYGVEAASQAFFGKSAKDLTLAESAILAAIPQAPTYYSPNGNHIDKLKARQHKILDDMQGLGYITKEKADEAKKEKLNFQKPAENIIAPHFVMYIKEYLSEKYGEKTVGEGGLKIITTLDLEKQKIAEEVLVEGVEKNKKWDALNAAIVSLDPKTGQILSMVGSVDYFNESIDGQVNVVIRPRQPGSSFKPIVYAAAFKKGFTPETVVYDVETKFKNYDEKEYSPKNYNLKEHGPVTLRQALAGSLNIPAVKVIYLAGINKVLDLSDDLGYTTLKDRWRYGLSLVLGGGEVKLLEHTSAYGAFAQEGELHRTSGILKVEDRNGDILEEYRDRKVKILETQTARQINSILSDNGARAYIFGEGNFLTLKDRQVAAKTGTTNDYHDAWTIGYTPSLVTGVWVGNSNNDPMKRGADGSVVAAPIWNAYMSKVLASTPVQSFIQPSPTTSEKPVLNGLLKEGIKVKVDRISGKLATENTPPDLVEERNYRVLHSILFYIDKDDPQGPPPQSPETEPQFKAWEDAVLDWGKRNNIVSEEPPTEYDDIHTPDNLPTLTIFSPQNNSVISDRNMVIDISPYSPRGIRKVEYFLGGKLIGEKFSAPYNLSVYIDNNDIPNGFTSLRVVAYDDVGNTRQEYIDVFVDLPFISSGASWIFPNEGNILTKESFPMNIALDIPRPQNIDMVSISFESPSGSKQLINSTRQISSNTLSVLWDKYPGPGIYGINFTVINKDGYTYRGDKILVEIK